MKLQLKEIQYIGISGREMNLRLLLKDNISLLMILEYQREKKNLLPISYRVTFKQSFGGKTDYLAATYLFNSRGGISAIMLPDFDKSSSDTGNYSLVEAGLRTLSTRKEITDHFKDPTSRFLTHIMPRCLDVLKKNALPVVREFRKKYAVSDACYNPRSPSKSKILRQSMSMEGLISYFTFDYIINHHHRVFRFIHRLRGQ